MKLVFIFPLINEYVGTPIKWLPLSTSTLIGNLKKKFPKIIFHQLDLEEEIKGAISKKKLDRGYSKLINHFVELNHDIPTDKDSIKFKDFFADIVDYFELGGYDHYFFAVYNRNKTAIKANILLARYLKRRYKDKKIIFGGIYGFGDDCTKRSFEELSFIDSFVTARRGESATKEIIEQLLTDNKLERIYQRYSPSGSAEETLRYLPDFTNFKSFKYFQYFPKDLEKIYNIKLRRETTEKEIVFIPYAFSKGCFWSKCAYCGNSGRAGFYCKDIDKIVRDLIKLKEIYQTKYFIFFNNNFNSDLDFSKKLLKSFIKNRLDILWTDSFNLMILDKELLDLLVRAGCFRMDIGVTTVNPKIQKLYNSILQDNTYLENLKKISQKGIWTHINMIVNLPHQYTVKEDREVLGEYMSYIDGITLNSYRRHPSELGENYKSYNLIPVNESIYLNNKSFLMPFIEKDFEGTLNKRKELAAQNFMELENFFSRHNPILNNIHLYLLGHLYNELGFEHKDKIKKIIAGICQTQKK